MSRKYAILFIFMACSCDIQECEIKQDVLSTEVDIDIERKEQELIGSNSINTYKNFLSENRVLADFFLDAIQYPSDSILAARLFNLMSQPSIDSLKQDAYRRFENIDFLENQFELAFQHLKYYYPKAPVPNIQTMITGLYRDLYVSDTLIVVGIDFFIGADAKYKPNEVPEYIYRRFTPEYIVPASFLFLSEQYNQVNLEDQTLLNEMVMAGKTYYFAKAMMPCTPDHMIIGFTAEELNEVNKNQEVVWANFVQNQLLYETNHMLKNKFMGERPNVYEIGEKCPGRIGAWVGWEIVKAYMANNNVTLQELMNETDAKKIFLKSKYRPA